MSNPHFVERKSCPVCGSLDLSELFHGSYTEPPIRSWLEKRQTPRGMVEFDLLEGAEYVLLECAACALIFQRDIPDEYMSEIAYERWVDPDKAWDRRSKGIIRARGRYALEIMGVLDFMKREPESLRFLDYGMGWGFWVEMARAFAVDVYGLEPAASRNSRASEQGLQVIDVEQMKNLSFDFINTEQVFEHLPEPYETAVQLSQVLAPGGILKISVPNSMRVKRNLKRGNWLKKGNPLNDVFPLQHINAFTHRSIIRLGERVGLEHVPIPARLRYRYMPTWERPSRLLKRTVGAHYRTLRDQTTGIWFRRGGAPATAPTESGSVRRQQAEPAAKSSRRRG